MIAALYNIPIDAQQLQRFAFHNRDSHDLAIQAVRRQRNMVLPNYLLDPIPVTDFATWLRTHQAAHNSVNSVLGISGNDLSDVDPTKLEQLSAWVELHANEHVQWGILLGIG